MFSFFKFSTAMERDLGGPWHFANIILILKRWCPGLKFTKEALKTIPVWVKLSKVPISLSGKPRCQWLYANVPEWTNQSDSEWEGVDQTTVPEDQVEPEFLKDIELEPDSSGVVDLTTLLPDIDPTPESEREQEFLDEVDELTRSGEEKWEEAIPQEQGEENEEVNSTPDRPGKEDISKHPAPPQTFARAWDSSTSYRPGGGIGLF
ncbi:hypothetical protein Droror1_Dr00028128 [Drosera rotundifolia]